MSNLEQLLAVMAALRDPRAGCPWDRAQTAASLVPHTLEEAYEVAEAVARQDPAALRDELGDLLFQIVFYARLAEEEGAFRFEDVAAGIVDKLTRRHPHVFGDASVADAEDQTAAWEAHKAEERRTRLGQHGALDGVALALPALTRAAKLQKRAARVGFDWPEIAPVFAKVAEELDEVRQEVMARGPAERVAEEIGDLLFTCVNLARHAGVNPETALLQANRKFERRFARMEALAEAGAQGLAGLDADSLERLWQAAKDAERPA